MRPMEQAHDLLVFARNEVTSLEMQADRLRTELALVEELRARQVRMIDAIHDCYGEHLKETA